jgi:hypothetical protein
MEMEMNDRQFAAAHDRYLGPPDEEFDDTTDDEMDLADIRKQEQRDREDWLAEQHRQHQEDQS